MLIQEGGDAETREKQPRVNSAALGWVGVGLGSASRDTHNEIIFELFIEITPLPPKSKMLTFFITEKTT